MAFTTLFSNRVETLSERLMAGMQSPLHDPLTPEYVLVDNLVMGQWLNLQLAQQQGIAANIRYIQPHELFWLLARAVVSNAIPKETPLSKEEMTWKLFGLFGSEALLALDCIKPVKNYLAGANSQQLKRYQLAASVADLFDQYLVYRPEMLLRWENTEKYNDNEAWQRELWRRLSGVQHRALIEKNLLEKLETEKVSTVQAAIPMQRLFVFGITSMPPHFVRMLLLLGKHIDVQLFAVNPCSEYWFDIASAKSLVKKQGKRQFDEGVIGNPLLASQGTQVKEFIESLYAAMDELPFVDEEWYSEPAGDRGSQISLLHSIQQEILQLSYQNSVASLAMQESAPKKIPLPDSERQKTVNSIRIHNCHSPLREVEVLHDQLLALFKQDATLKPRDVVVMMPQVAPYVPYIETVFGNTAAALPYHITDRSWLEEVPLLNTLDLLLTLPESRLPLTDILAMLEVPAVQVKFGLDRDSFEKLKRWLQESGVRWGLDAAHREQQGLPAYSEFSWDFGINRMLAGFSMMATQLDGVAEPVTLAHDSLAVLPYDEIEGGASAVLDGFLQFW
ncbi:MAG TPA: exodeoxyribonuclease V subunit gamma, partial [Pseudomonadales bacterium]|nr:exodeoxyribonuclease V subunit gamma [Pseudomonadales bacterium]